MAAGGTLTRLIVPSAGAEFVCKWAEHDVTGSPFYLMPVRVDMQVIEEVKIQSQKCPV